MEARQAVTAEMAKRYRKARKKERGRLLDELSTLTGRSRRQARRALHQALHRTGPPPTRSRPPPVIYGEDLQAPLVKLWAVLGGLCGKRMAPFMGEAVAALERFGELHLTERQRHQLASMSAATIDRRLAPQRQRLKMKGRSGTKPGTMLKGRIPVKTFSEWDDAAPGFCQVDLVGHEGGDPKGDFCQSLDLTDVATGWTEPGALKNKAQRWVFAELKRIRSDLPFDLRGLDCDNGSEFINNELQRYCEAEGITFTRGRTYRKNDSCFIEQKNWSVIRQATGYARYDTDAELAVLRQLYTHLRLLVNFFQPVMKLVAKTREGAKVRKRYDTAQTPYQRVLRSPEVSPAAKVRITTPTLPAVTTLTAPPGSAQDLGLVALGGSGDLSIVNAGADPAEVSVDVLGYLTDGSDPEAIGDVYTKVAPTQVLAASVGTAGKNAQVAGVGAIPAITTPVPPTAVLPGASEKLE